MNGIASIVLAVDDEPAILRLVKAALAGDGFSVVTAANGAEALDLLELHRPDAVILDILMPGMTGLELMKEIQRRSHTPVLLLSGRRVEDAVVRGLELGADDYLGKPFNPAELAARIRALVRSKDRRAKEEHVLSTGDIEIDFGLRVVRKNGEPIHLAPTEWLIVSYLASRPGSLVRMEELLAKVWGPQYIDDLQNLRVRISRIRALIEDDPRHPRYIKTFTGQGYLLDPSVAQSAA